MTDRLKYAINCREDPLSGWGEGEGGKEVVGIVVMVWWGLELYQLLCFILIKRESTSIIIIIIIIIIISSNARQNNNNNGWRLVIKKITIIKQ